MNKQVGKEILNIIKIFLQSLLIVIVLFGAVCALAVGKEVYSFKAVAEEKFQEIDPSLFHYTSNTIIYDANGEIISEMNEIMYEPVKISEVSPYVYNGYIAVEDQNFKTHHGIDYKAVLRAAIEYVRHHGAVTQGGSTITQQVLKNSVLSSERTFDRKFTELFLAPMFEDAYSKDEIMELYVNMNFFGNNCYGIEAASRYYFAKSAKDLTLAESAILVGLTKGASFYNPLTNMEGVINRQVYTLERMVEEGFITEEQKTAAEAEELEFIYERPELPTENYMTSFAIYSAAINLMEQEGFEFKYLFETNEEMYPIIEAGAVTYDVVCPSDYMIQKMIENDLLTEIDFNNIPNYKYIGDRYKEMSKAFDPQNKYSVPYTWGTVGILYNTKLVEELGLEPPTCWADLWDPRYKGEILMQDSVRDAFMVTLKLLGYSMNSTDVNELEAAKRKLIDQKPLVQAYVVDQVRDKMIGGEAAVGVVYSGEMLYIQEEVAAQDLGYELEYILPEEGTNLWLDSWVIPRDAKNKRNAELWIDFLCRPDIALRNFEYITYSTPNIGTYDMLDEELQQNEALFPNDEDLGDKCEVYEYLGEDADNFYNELWKEVKAK